MTVYESATQSEQHSQHTIREQANALQDILDDDWLEDIQLTTHMSHL